MNYIQHVHNAIYYFQLYFEGEVDTKHSYIAIGGLYLTPDYCEIQPPKATRGENANSKRAESFGGLVYCQRLLIVFVVKGL